MIGLSWVGRGIGTGPVAAIGGFHELAELGQAHAGGGVAVQRGAFIGVGADQDIDAVNRLGAAEIDRGFGEDVVVDDVFAGDFGGGVVDRFLVGADLLLNPILGRDGAEVSQRHRLAEELVDRGLVARLLLGELGEGGVEQAREIALHHGPVEQALGGRGAQQHADIARARGLAADGDTAGVATEGCDIGMDPLQGGDQVLHRHVTGAAAVFLGQLGVRKKALGAGAVLHGHDNDALGRQFAGPELDLGGMAVIVAAAIDPDIDGQLVRRVLRRCEQVEVEAVLARLRLEGLVGVELIAPERAGRVELHVLQHRIAPGVGLAHAAPGRRRRRRGEALGAGSGAAEREALEDLNARDVSGNTLHLAAGDGDDVDRFGLGRHADGDGQQGEEARDGGAGLRC